MSAEAPPPIDYTAMDGVTLLDSLRDDASKWATAFRQTAIRLGYSDMDEGWLIGWFANAIENSHDVRLRRGMPDTAPHVPRFPT
jgi:hypothetical protein